MEGPAWRAGMVGVEPAGLLYGLLPGRGAPECGRGAGRVAAAAASAAVSWEDVAAGAARSGATACGAAAAGIWTTGAGAAPGSAGACLAAGPGVGDAAFFAA